MSPDRLLHVLDRMISRNEPVDEINIWTARRKERAKLVEAILEH
jgi:hypothetical protein